MKKQFFIITILFLIINLNAKEEIMHKMHTKNNAKIIYHVNPMPNFMRVVKQSADMLELSEKQNEQLKKWQKENHSIMSKLKKDTMEAEDKLRKMSLLDATSEELLDQYNAISKLRQTIAKQKIMCRENMKKILNDEQMKEVILDYTDNYLEEHSI